ncbi:MAG: hypothetical protein ACRBCJ_02535 [Hyphomicrobiaceae bacterium]
MKSSLLFVTTCLSAVIFVNFSCAAHDEKTNPGTAKHGGQYTEYEVHHGIEMVATEAKLVFHMTQHLEPVDMKGSSFKAFIQTDAGMRVLALQPEGSTLIADLPSPLPKGAKIALTGKDADGHSLQARFVKE